jgi:NAD(P)-dependent dehydrogenase (short-subunit alcohol dehydrogenase family)
MAPPFGRGHQLAPATLRRYNPKDGHSRPAPEEAVVGRLENQVALVTGAASGIGYACSLRFAQEGAIVVGFDRAECLDWGAVAGVAPKNAYIRGDVTDEATIEALVRGAVRDFGSLDVTVNAAGVAGGGPVHLLPLQEWNRVMTVNATGTFLVGKYAAGVMMDQPSGGSIINVASIEGITGTEGGSCYNASKGAVVILTKNMAIDYGRRGVRVNAVCPGFIDTPLMRATFDSPGMAPARQRYQDEHKLGRFGRPAEIAGAALFLASSDASFVTGHALVVDGGFTAGMRAGVLAPLGL